MNNAPANSPSPKTPSKHRIKPFSLAAIISLSILLSAVPLFISCKGKQGQDVSNATKEQTLNQTKSASGTGNSTDPDSSARDVNTGKGPLRIEKSPEEKAYEEQVLQEASFSKHYKYAEILQKLLSVTIKKYLDSTSIVQPSSITTASRNPTQNGVTRDIPWDIYINPGLG